MADHDKEAADDAAETADKAPRKTADETSSSNAAKAAPPKPSRARRVWRVLRWVLLAPVALLAVLLIALHTSPVQERLRGRVEQRLQQRFHGDVKLGKLDIALLGDVRLQNLTIVDLEGDEVVGVDNLLLRPDWWALIGGELVLDQASLNGVRVHLVKHEDGTTNIKRLLKAKPEEPPKPPSTSKKKIRIIVRNLDIGPIDLKYDKFDGTHITVDKLTLGGSLDITPGDKTARVSLPVITSNFSVNKQGLKLALNDFSTGIELDLTGGAGTLTVLPTKAKASIEREEKHNELDLDLAGVTLNIEPGKLGATLDKLLAGALLIEALELQRTTDDDGNLIGQQKANVIGLKLDAERVNSLLHREVLKRDVKFEASLTGPADNLAIALKVAAGTGTIDITGTVNAAKDGRPAFDVTLLAKDLHTAELLVAGVAPDILLDSLRVDAQSGDDGVIHAKVLAEQLRVKKYLIDSVALDADIDGKHITIKPFQVDAYGHKAIARGEVDLNTRLVDISVTVDGDIGATLDKLRDAGIAIKTRLPAGKVTLKEGALTLRIHGNIDGLLHAELKADDFRIAGGAIDADVKARLLRNPKASGDEKKVALQHAEGLIELRHLSINQLLALRGKALKGMSARLSAQLRVSDVPEKPKLGYRVVIQTQPHALDRIVAGQPTLKTVLHGSVDKHNARVKLSLDGIQKDKEERLLSGIIELPLFISDDHKGIDPFRQLLVKLDMPRRAFSELTPYLPKRLLLNKKTGKPREIPSNAAVEAHIDITGTSASPAGTVKLDAHVPALGQAMQRIKLDGTLSSSTPALAFRSDISAWLDASQPAAITGNATFDTDHSPLLGRMGDKRWSLDLTIKPQQIHQLPLSADARRRLRGTAGGKIHLDGNSEGAFNGDIVINARKVTSEGKGPFDADVVLGLGDKPTSVAIDVSFAGNKVIDADGNVALTGPDIMALVKNRPLSTFDKLQLATNDVTLDIKLPRNPLSSYASLKSSLAPLPGDVGGLITVRGVLGKPVINGEVTYGSFTSVAGTPGRVALVIKGNRNDVEVRLELGPNNGGRAPVRLIAQVPAAKLIDYVSASGCYRKAAEAKAGTPPVECPDDVRLPVSVIARADGADVRKLVPAFVVKGQKFDTRGNLNWTLDGELSLDPKPRYAQRDGKQVKLPPIAAGSKLDGSLALVDGLFGIPGTKRRYHDIVLKLKHSLSRISIEALSLRESDLEKKNRSIDIDGHITLTQLRPDLLAVNIKAQDWLVFGGSKLGKPDAPRGALTTTITAKGTLAKAIKNIDVEVTQLELLIPDRFARAHQPEVLSLGDVIFLDADSEPGKLPIPESKRPKKKPPVPAVADAGSTGDGKADGGKKAKAPTMLDVHVRIPKPIHILQHPLNLHAAGQIDISVRGDKRTVRGKLNMSRGKLSLGGRQHILQHGTVVFDEANPGGYMDLLFGRREPNPTLMDLSEASGGNLVTIHLEGPLAARRTTLSGAGSPGTLFDLLSVHNAGRQRYMSQPDMPATVTVEYPQHMNLLLMSYLSVNAPHLLFLDRVAAWSDMYDNHSTSGYGQLQNYESVRYTGDGDVRVRAVMRPRTPGRSSAELQLDYLFENTDQTTIGVGLGAGSRLGGGPAIFFEWSSKD